MTSSNLLACTTGNSAGLAPFKEAAGIDADFSTRSTSRLPTNPPIVPSDGIFLRPSVAGAVVAGKTERQRLTSFVQKNRCAIGKPQDLIERSNPEAARKRQRLYL